MNKLPNYSNQKGAAPVLLLLAALGLLIFLFISNTFDFKDKLFNKLFPKPPSHAAEVNSVPGEILLKFKPGVDDKAKDNIRNSHGIKIEEVIDKIDVERGKVPPEARDKVIEALKKNPQVEYAEPNYIGQTLVIPNDPGYDPNSNWNLVKVNAPSAWDISQGNANVIVSVSDSGVYSEHEDLQGKILPGYNFVDNNTNTSDVSGHGTIVTGVVAAATNNGKGIASLGWDTTVMPVRVVTTSGGIQYWNGAQSIIYSADHGGKIVNMSWGGTLPSSTLQDAINYAWGKGLVLVAAGGNYGTCCILYPAAADHVIGVGATNIGDDKANFSSIDDTDPNTPVTLDVMAPGVGVYSTDATGSYAQYSGTSFSSPHVAALAALIFAANPSLTNQQVVDIITSTAKDLGDPGWDQYYGYGRIDAYAALQKAIGTTPAPIPTPTPTSTPSPSPTPTPSPSPSDTTLPTVSITNPLNGVIVKVNSTVNITASATDNIGVSKVEFYVNNSLKCTSAVIPYTCSWKVPGKKNISYSIQAKAYDTVNNSNSYTITVKAQ